MTMRDRRLLCFIAGSTLLVAVYGQWTATLAPYLAEDIAGGVEIFAYIVSINGAVVILGNPLARRFVERTGPLTALPTGCAFFIMSQFGFLVSEALTGFAISMIVFTIGEILVLPSEYAMVDEISTVQNRGTSFGGHSISMLGSFLGPTLGGLAHSAFGGTAMFAVYALLAAGGALAFCVGVQMPLPVQRD